MSFRFLQGSNTKHAIHCILLVLWMLMFSSFTGLFSYTPIDPCNEYGYKITYMIIFLRLLCFLAVPQALFNLIGLCFFNAFPPPVTLKSSPLLAPSICVRVVTRGLYPCLVKETVASNMATLRNAGMENFYIEVVTDVAIPELIVSDLNSMRLRQVVVPSSYTTKSRALYKSRALQYCLEDDVNILSDDDWILHLDEETLLTDSCVKGILNFVSNGNKHQFGQGLITYAKTPISFNSMSKFLQNRMCTVADSFRVSDDMGKLRCQFKLFHKPLFGWKGSYVVSQVGPERAVTFDNGPEGSKAEDCYFAISALSHGYSFDFIEGEMLEKSPFTFSDFFKQRKRWMQGIYMVVFSTALPFRSKLVLGISLASWLAMPLTTSNLLICCFYPFSMGFICDMILSFAGALGIYMYAFGYFKQHPVHKYSWARMLVIVPEITVATALSIIVENLAVIFMWGGDWYDFHIVEKEDSSYHVFI